MIAYHTNLRWLLRATKKPNSLSNRWLVFRFTFLKSRYRYTIIGTANVTPHYSFSINGTQTFVIYLQISVFFLSLHDLPFRMLMTWHLCFLFILRLTPTKNVIIFRLPFGCTKNMNNGRVNLQSLGKHPKYSTQEEIMEQYGNGGAKVLKLLKVKKHKP